MIHKLSETPIGEHQHVNIGFPIARECAIVSHCLWEENGPEAFQWFLATWEVSSSSSVTDTICYQASSSFYLMQDRSALGDELSEQGIPSLSSYLTEKIVKLHLKKQK